MYVWLHAGVHGQLEVLLDEPKYCHPLFHVVNKLVVNKMRRH